MAHRPLAILVLLVGLIVAGGPAQASGVDEAARHMVELLNSYREAAGVEPVRPDPRLASAADRHSKALLEARMTGRSAGRRPLANRLDTEGYDFLWSGEAAATGPLEPVAILQAMQRSDAHDEVLRQARARDVGVAILRDPNVEGRYIWTLTLAAPAR